MYGGNEQPARRRRGGPAAQSSVVHGPAGAGSSGAGSAGTGSGSAGRGRAGGSRRRGTGERGTSGRSAGGRAAGEPPGHPEDPLGDPEWVAREICLRLLTAQARSRAELATALARRGIPADVVERVLSRFGQVGLIDDRAFAEAFVVSRHGARGLARRALSVELRQRGIDPATASAALQGLDERTEEATARALVARRLPGTAGLDPTARARRLVGMLARKGYPADLAYRVVREELAADGATWEAPDPPVDLETE
jgi:regulatory protein